MPPNKCPDWYKGESDDLLPHVVRGMASVTKFIYGRAHHYNLKHSDLKEWHRKIFKDVVPKDYYAGNFRSPNPDRPCLKIDVEVCPASGGPQLPGARFSDVPTLMTEFSRELSSKTSRTDTFIKESPTPTDRAKAAIMLAAFCAGKIVQIHPFINGNGRISRLAANFFLHRYGYPFLLEKFRPTINVNPSYETSAAACMRGDYNLLFRYLLVCLGNSCSERQSQAQLSN